MKLSECQFGDKIIIEGKPATVISIHKDDNNGICGFLGFEEEKHHDIPSYYWDGSIKNEAMYGKIRQLGFNLNDKVFDSRYANKVEIDKLVERPYKKVSKKDIKVGEKFWIHLKGSLIEGIWSNANVGFSFTQDLNSLGIYCASLKEGSAVYNDLLNKGYDINTYKFYSCMDRLDDAEYYVLSSPTETKQQEKSSGFANLLKNDFTNAGYRVASTQITKAIKTAIVSTFKSKGMDDAKLSVLKELMSGPIGDALIAYILGQVLSQLPAQDPRFIKLANEFRVHGLVTAGNEMMDLTMKYVLPAIKDAIKNLPVEKEPEAVEQEVIKLERPALSV